MTDRVEEIMRCTLPPISFQAIGFENALNFLRDLVRVNISPNWVAMQEMGITPNTEVSLQLHNVTAETALREILDKAAGREGILDYVLSAHTLKISTTYDLALQRTLRFCSRA